jgi:hypothetical protein
MEKKMTKIENHKHEKIQPFIKLLGILRNQVFSFM